MMALKILRQYQRPPAHANPKVSGGIIKEIPSFQQPLSCRRWPMPSRRRACILRLSSVWPRPKCVYVAEGGRHFLSRGVLGADWKSAKTKGAIDAKATISPAPAGSTASAREPVNAPMEVAGSQTSLPKNSFASGCFSMSCRSGKCRPSSGLKARQRKAQGFSPVWA